MNKSALPSILKHLLKTFSHFPERDICRQARPPLSSLYCDNSCLGITFCFVSAGQVGKRLIMTVSLTLRLFISASQSPWQLLSLFLQLSWLSSLSKDIKATSRSKPGDHLLLFLFPVLLTSLGLSVIESACLFTWRHRKDRSKRQGVTDSTVSILSAKHVRNCLRLQACKWQNRDTNLGKEVL